MANRETQPERLKDDIDPDFVARQVDDLITLVSELKTDLNNLRQDIRRHDHGSPTYTAATNRINGSDNTFSGSAETSSDVAASVPVTWVDKK